MKNFVIAYMDFFDNIMKMQKVESDSPEHALQDFLYGKESDNFRNMSIEDMESYAFDTDSMVGIIEV